MLITQTLNFDKLGLCAANKMQKYCRQFSSAYDVEM